MGFGGIPDDAAKRIVIVFQVGINQSILTITTLPHYSPTFCGIIGLR